MLQTLTTLADSNSLLGGMWLMIWLILLVAIVAAFWSMFEKADEAGWKAIIPLYNTYTLFRIAGRNGWGMLLLFIPFVNVVVMIVLSIDLAKHFGKSAAFGIFGLWIFSVIGFLILGYGDAKYVGPKHA